MYIPFDPHKSNVFWKKMEVGLKKDEQTHIIINGNYINESKPKCLNTLEVKELMTRLKQMEYVRVGTSHGMPMPSHFSIKLISYQHALLNDLITLDNSIENIQRSLSFIIEYVFWELPMLKILTIPFIVDLKDVSSAFNVNINNDKSSIEIIKI